VIVTAAVIATGERERLYPGLSIIVSRAAEGEDCSVLLSFAGAELFTGPLREDEPFTNSLRALRDQAIELPNVRLYVCAATDELGQVGISMDGLDGVMSTPRFLRETAGSQLLFV
jgi:peroxiredoxin family protein